MEVHTLNKKKGKSEKTGQELKTLCIVLILVPVPVRRAADVSLWIFNQSETWPLSRRTGRPWVPEGHLAQLLHILSCSSGYFLAVMAGVCQLDSGNHLQSNFYKWFSFKPSLLRQRLIITSQHGRNAEGRVVVLMFLLSRPVETCHQSVWTITELSWVTHRNIIT